MHRNVRGYQFQMLEFFEFCLLGARQGENGCCHPLLGEGLPSFLHKAPPLLSSLLALGIRFFTYSQSAKGLGTAHPWQEAGLLHLHGLPFHRIRGLDGSRAIPLYKEMHLLTLSFQHPSSLQKCKQEIEETWERRSAYLTQAKRSYWLPIL